jgi:sugar/nucleoside kinase (ribokinase family)
MNDIDMDKAGSVFICGLEVEEETGNEIVDFVYEHPELELYFSTGPRIMDIPPDRMEKLLAHRDKRGKGPFLHLNESEAFNFTGESGVEKEAEYLASKTGNSVVITRGENGCYCLEKAGASGSFIPAHHAIVVDTVGAGDAHCGALIASLKNGIELEEACVLANKAGAAVVGVRGAILMDELPVTPPPFDTD